MAKATPACSGSRKQADNLGRPTIGLTMEEERENPVKLELSIKTNYLPSWGAYEGIRELVQNGADARVELGASFEARHRKPDTLVLENEGATLPHEALLFGHTSKAGRSDLIGKFGEGLKLGVLALVR